MEEGEVLRAYVVAISIAVLAAFGVAAPASADPGFSGSRKPPNHQYCKHKPNKPHKHCEGRERNQQGDGGGQAPAGGGGQAPAGGAGVAPAAGENIPVGNGIPPGAGQAPQTGAQAPGQGTAPFRGAAGGSRDLPFTGFDLLLIVLLGAALVAVGASLRAGERLKRRWRPLRSRA